MKTLKIALLGLFALASSSVTAQKTDKRADRKTKMQTYLIENLELTNTEKGAFIPVYEQYQIEKKGLRESSRAMKKKGKKMEVLSDAELEEVIQASFVTKQKELELKKKYHVKFKEALPMKKVAKLYHIEKRMGRRVYKNDKKRGKHNPPLPPKPTETPNKK